MFVMIADLHRDTLCDQVRVRKLTGQVIEWGKPYLIACVDQK